MSTSAPVYSIASEQQSRADSAWAAFSSPSDTAELCSAWLALLASQIDSALAALLLTREPGGATLGVAAAWPDPRLDLQYLGPVARQALELRAGVVVAPGGGQPPQPGGAAHVGYPIEVGGELLAVVAFDIGPGAVSDLQEALRRIHWASAWLLDHFRQQQLAEREAALQRAGLLNGILATAMQHSLLQPSLLAVSNELTTRMKCDRVSVGMERRGQVEPLVMSNTANFDRRSDLVRWLGEAMDEVLDLGVPVCHPTPAKEDLAAPAHAEAARQLAVAAMLSVPVKHESQTVGVITLERNAGRPFGTDERELAASLGVLLGPIWALQRGQ